MPDYCWRCTRFLCYYYRRMSEQALVRMPRPVCFELRADGPFGARVDSMVSRAYTDGFTRAITVLTPQTCGH